MSLIAINRSHTTDVLIQSMTKATTQYVHTFKVSSKIRTLGMNRVIVLKIAQVFIIKTSGMAVLEMIFGANKVQIATGLVANK